MISRTVQAENGPGPLSYDRFNYCTLCRIRVDKNRHWCPECNYRVRSKPRGAKGRRKRLLQLGIKRY